MIHELYDKWKLHRRSLCLYNKQARFIKLSRDIKTKTVTISSNKVFL